MKKLSTFQWLVLGGLGVLIVAVIVGAVSITNTLNAQEAARQFEQCMTRLGYPADELLYGSDAQAAKDDWAALDGMIEAADHCHAQN